MNNSPKKMVWDDCLDETPKSSPVKIKSLVNKKYQNNFSVVKDEIARNNRRYLEERKKVSSLTIRDSSIENGFNDVLNYIDKMHLPPEVSELVLKTTLRTSMERIPKSDTYSKEVYLSSIKSAKSIKLHNIILNFPKCLSILCESYGNSWISDKYLSYIFSLLMFVKDVLNLATVKLTETEAVIISCIYSYNGEASLENIYSRLRNDNLLTKYGLSQKTDIMDYLQNLINLKIISENDGQYKLIEDVFV